MKIKELRLFTPNLLEQIDFYSSTLGLQIKKKTNESVSFIIGKSILTFIQREQFTPYHFAFNIPSNQENEALNWLKERVEILKDENIEIHDFAHWNAKAMYFYDADKNIVEFIARKNQDNGSALAFDQHSLIEISEIGIPTNNIEKEYAILQQSTGLGIYSGSLERFCSIGDENGLFICINKNLKDFWFPTDDTPHSSDFSIGIEENNKAHQIKFFNETLTIESSI